MIKQKVWIAVLIMAVLLAANVAPAFAMPPLPSSFWGTVRVDGANVATGTVVSAWINGVKYAQWTVTLYNGDTVYSLDVPGDDTSSTSVVEGGVDGNTIVYYIGDLVAAQTGIWHSGTNVELNLTAMTTTTQAVSLLTGWNLVTLPLTPVSAYDAETLLQAINAQGNTCNQIVQWKNSVWTTHSLGVPANKFAIAMGEGYFVKCPQGSSWNLTGYSLQSSIAINLVIGWNLLGIPYPASGYTAQGVLDAITADGGYCSSIVRWSNNVWVTHSNGIPPNNFSILPYEGYFVKCTTPTTFTP